MHSPAHARGRRPVPGPVAQTVGGPEQAAICQGGGFTALCVPDLQGTGGQDMGRAMDSIDLAAEPDFRLGPWLVRASLGMAWRDGAVVRLEPRLLQALIVLVRADGLTVSRADLMRQAGGLAGEEDAIDRDICRLRAVLSVDGVIGFDTIPKIGYRLKIAKEPAPVTLPPPAPDPVPARRRLLLGAGVAALALLVAAGGTLLAQRVSVRRDPGPELQPAGGPDGNRLAEMRSTPSPLLRLGPDGSHEPLLSASNRVDGDPDISARGGLAFASDRTGLFEIWVAPPGRSPAPVTQFQGPFTRSPRWAPDGRRLALVSTIDGAPGLFILDNGSGRLKRVAPDPGSEDRAPAWSRDGQRLYFASNRLGDWRIWITRPPYEEAMPITEAGWRVAKESADGRWLYMMRDGEGGLWRQPADGGEVEMLADLPDADDNESWVVGPAGIYLVERPGNGRARILLLPSDGGPGRAVAELPDTLTRSSLALDPQGRLVIGSNLGALIDRVGAGNGKP